MLDDDHCGAIYGMKIGRGTRSTRRFPAPVLLLSTTNPTGSDPDSNPGRRGGKPGTNRLSYGTADILILTMLLQLVTHNAVKSLQQVSQGI
jgi:hypothetical protein